MNVITRIRCPVYATESIDDVFLAIANFFPVTREKMVQEKVMEPVTLSRRGSISYEIPVIHLVFELQGTDALQGIFNAFRKSLIVETARRLLIREMKDDGTTSFFLNKQAALKNTIHFSEENESPLGPITITIESDNIQGVLDWLAPPTKDGLVLEQGLQKKESAQGMTDDAVENTGDGTDENDEEGMDGLERAEEERGNGV